MWCWVFASILSRNFASVLMNDIGPSMCGLYIINVKTSAARFSLIFNALGTVNGALELFGWKIGLNSSLKPHGPGAYFVG